MQGNHHVQLAGRHAAYVTALEHQPRMLQACGRGVAQADHVFTQFNAGDHAFSLQGIAQVIMNGEGQVALARAEIRHLYRLVQRQR
ncbi:hypothetical protein D3C71_1849220 [compost metagenome]